MPVTEISQCLLFKGYPDPNYKIWLSSDQSDRYRFSLQYEGERIGVIRNFLGIIRSETFKMPDGIQYHYRYFYKKGGRCS